MQKILIVCGLILVDRFARDLGSTLPLANRSPRGGCLTLELPWVKP